jgi:hypothetical protein
LFEVSDKVGGKYISTKDYLLYSQKSLQVYQESNYSGYGKITVPIDIGDLDFPIVHYTYDTLLILPYDID